MRLHLKRKSAPASARSCNPRKGEFSPTPRKIKTGLTKVSPFLLGGGGIRTHGTLVTYDGFQDRSDKPLWHSSICFIRCISILLAQFFLSILLNKISAKFSFSDFYLNFRIIFNALFIACFPNLGFNPGIFGIPFIDEGFGEPILPNNPFISCKPFIIVRICSNCFT